MTQDVNFWGVLIPGLVVLAAIALVGTIATIRLLFATRLSRIFTYRPLIELALFITIYGLLTLYLPLNGLLP